MKKRVLSLLMAIAICLSMLPSAALAEIPGTGTNEVQTEQQITDEQKPDEQKPDEQKPDEQKPDEQKPDEQKPEEQNPDEQKPDKQNPDEQNPDKQNPDEQKPAKAPRKEPAAATHTGDHGGYTLPEGKTWQGVSSLPSDSGYYYLTKDVTIDSTWKPADGTVLCLNGYGISMTKDGPVIEVQPDVTFTLCDCNGSQNRYTHGITHGGNGRGAGVLVGKSAKIGEEATAGTNTAVFNMYGGAIYNNYPWPASGENAASASGVLIGGGTFNMYGGKITDNKLMEDRGLGGGVFVANQGSFLMSGGEISGNHATEGGGVFVGGLYGHHDLYAFSGGTFTMSGGSITGNSGTGGGVYVSSGSNTSFTVSGSAQITGKTGSNVYLNKNKDGQSNTIKVDGVLDGTASIGVSVETANQVVATGISAENAERFTSDNNKYSLQYDSTSQTLTLVGHDNHPVCGDVTCTDGEHAVKTTWRSISTEAELKAVQMGCCYYLTQDVEIKDTWKPKSGVVLCLNGHSITFVNGDNYSVIEVRSGTFTLCDCSGSKGKITHGYSSSNKKYLGRGVSVNGGMFNMYGGSITGNTVQNGSGGGMYVKNATFNMYGGSITGNTTTNAGGGVYVTQNAEFTMNGGEISGNTTSSSYGGGVCVDRVGSFNMKGGSITGNISDSFGGGVFVISNGNFTMKGGSITDNTSSSFGGGVYVSDNANFTVSGNVNITGNTKSDKTVSNVYLYAGKTITVGGALGENAKIGVTSGTTPATGKFVTIATGAKDSCTVDNFTADVGEPYGIKVESTGTGVDVNLYNGLPHIHYRCNGKDENGAETCNGIGHTEKKVLEFTPWTDASALPTTSGEYYLTTDVTLDSAWDLRGDGLNDVRFVLCLNGHSIKLKDSADGNVIDIGKNATLALCDCNGSKAGNGKIIGSKASGVNIANNGAFVMYGGSISGNGTGVSNDMLFHMYGGSITGNNRGVNVNSNDFIVAGKVNITGNTSNVYLPAGKTITVSGALGTGAQIGVTTANTLAEGSYLTIAKGIDYTLTETDLKAFTSDVGNSYGKRLNGNSIILTKGDLHTHALCGASCTHTGTHTDIVWQPLTYNAETQTLYYGSVEAARSPVKGSIQNEVDGKAEIKDEMHYEYTLPSGNYYLVEDITLAGNIKISSDVNLCLNGKTLSTTVKAYNVDVIGVNSQNGKCTLTLCDCDTAGRGMITSQNRTNSGVQIYGYRDGGTTTYGNLVMYGGTVKGFRNGVFVGDGTFNMFGGTITGNETGVSISSDASFTIGGTVNITVNTKNVDLGENVTITIDKSLTQDARIGITIAKEPTAGKLVWFATGATGELDYTGIFTPDAKDKSYVVRKGGDGSLFLGLHQHSWSYTANGATITAKCTAAGCPLENRIGGSVTISASNAVYDRSSKAATVTANDWQGDAVDSITVTYTGRNGTNYNSTDAPTNAGDYTASITVGTVTARVEYSIEKASLEYTVPTGLTAKYGQTLADISLPTGWAWKDATQSVGSVGEHTFKATYTPGDANYHAVTGIDVTVTVNKAPVTIQITGMPKGPIAYGDTFVLTITQTGDSSAVPENWTKFSNDRHFEYLREQSNPEKGEFKFQAIGVCTGKGCSQKFTVEFESDTHKGSLTVSTPNVTKKTLTGEDLVFGGLTTDFTKTYDGSTSFKKASVEIKSGAKVNTTDVLPAVKGSYVYNSKDVKDAKKVTFTSERTESENYILPAGLVVEREAKIEPAAITVTPNAVSKTYGADDPVLTYGVSGAVNSETPAFTGALARAEGKNVGDYAINQGTLALADKDTFKAGNYKLTLATTPVNFTITKATAPTLKNITVSQKYTVTTGEKAIGTVMPADAGTLTYTKGAESMTGSVTVTSWAVDSTGKVTYTLSGGAAGDTVTLPVTIKSTNYVDATVNVVITLTAKDIPNVTARDIVVTYDGNPIPADKITGTADVAGTWEWKAGTAVTNVSDSGTKTVVFKPADSVNYAEVEKTITVTINRATPTGEPSYTKITEKDKTLADAALGIGTLTPVGGKIEWVDDSDNVLLGNTKVEANKEYKWRYTPATADAGNYTTLTGTIVLYPASTGIVIYTPVNDAIFLSGANQIVAPGSAATFRINKNFGEFRSVAVDGVTLDKSNYRAWSGSTYVKLTPAYMKTLSAGTHTLAVYFTGATATTTFTISAGSSNPATGASDFAGVGAAVAMAAVSLLGAAAVLRRK